ncbi:nitrate reductase [Glutamicibacter sp. MNS18]|uniref:uracil-xanthine permease family protein n=1 Tax=Glutamicibacter sp. MNS18 TaxID=2989817 RepID=UPI0022357F77|nr:solute carrier family 23 protein [Glutamicibacter sp. MNS18]MCW4466690.1 nitrate reductase [Glutamicibacter sp. MNS18]
MKWSIHGNGKTITPGEVVAPEERLHWPQTISIGAQHILAMFGASILVPTITGFPVTTTLLFTGVATIIFLLMTRNQVPSYLGSSFALIAPVLAATAAHDMSAALGGIVMTGAALFLVGAIVQKTGTGWIHALMPPVVMGTIVALIGLNLASATLEPMQLFPATTFLTVLAVVVATVAFKGLLGRLSILVGLAAGYLIALAQGQVDFAPVADASWLGLPDFHTPTFQFDTALLFLPAVFVLIAENIGHVRTVGVMTGRDLSKFNGRALMADGAASVLAGFGGGSATTTYAENIGVMAASRVYSTAAYWVAAIVAMALAFMPKFGALIGTIPAGVIGGLGIVLYGMIGIVGARLWIEHKVDFGNPINLMTAGTGLIIAIAVTQELSFGQFQLGGIALGTLATLVVFHVMRTVAKLRGNNLESVTHGSEATGG